MRLIQLRRGMRYRFKTIKHRLRLRVRQLSGPGKARQFAAPLSDSPLPHGIAPDRVLPDAEDCSVPARPGASLPTLRRPARRNSSQ